MRIKPTKELLIERLNDQYPNYELITCPEHIIMRDEIILYCKKHKQEFKTKVKYVFKDNNNLCPLCKSEACKSDGNDIIKRLKNIYGDKYIIDDKFIYNGLDKDITLYCKKHGYFTVNAHRALSKNYGKYKDDLCPICASENRKMSTEDFLSKIPNEIKTKYIFDEKFVYNGYNKQVTILCPIHGYFSVYPNSIMNNPTNLCPKCRDKNVICNKQEFLEIARKNYPQYTFDNDIEYRGSSYPIKVKCEYHGYFYTNGRYLIRNKTKCLCPECKIDSKEQPNFIQNAKKRWGDKYDFSESVFVNEHTPIKVICPIHGAFYVKPSVFLDKQLNVLCPECYKTGEWLIEKLTQKYNNYYIFDEKYHFVDMYTPIIIKCPIDGYFEILPIDALYTRQNIICPKCQMNKKRTNNVSFDEFKKRYYELYPDTCIDLDKTENYYTISSKNLVTFWCKKHGKFENTAKNFFYKSYGLCPKCKTEKILNEINQKLNILHQNVLNTIKEKYSSIDITKIKGPFNLLKTDVKPTQVEYEIYCLHHGWERVTADYLLKHGCPKCLEGGNVQWKLYTTEDFVMFLKSLTTYYDYSLVEFIDIFTPIKIICPIHGIIEKIPNNIISTKSVSCMFCKQSNLERYIEDELIKRGYKYIKECGCQVFKWLGLKRLDFYLQDYNVAIECQGIQHFIQCDFFYDRESFEDLIERDKMKYNLCKQNEIKIFYYALKTDVNSEYAKHYIDVVYTNVDKMFKMIENNKK